MLTTRIIPCLDCRDGRVVKGVRFSRLRDVGRPAECAARYEMQGADEIVILDVAATVAGRTTQLDTVRAVRRVASIPLTVGGGVRSLENAAQLLESGADKVTVNSAAVKRPDLIDELAGHFGSQCAVLAVDSAAVAPDRWEVVIESGRIRSGISTVDWCREAVERGVGELLLTSWDRDGTRAGYCLELIAAIRQAVAVPLIASGGASGPQHLFEAISAGADAVLAASMFHDGDWTVGGVKDYLRRLGVEVRE